ncbi:hypothetical protein SETIT_9G198900v2 [Setaria italica]|uniref:Uncharacterized protein n=1 Tax=Setaria italica TaxID=4555 RepID=A0A368SIJ8_SETIT|nr:hypothetical protein SETIT_9G198900v2 [Setaria italica]
MADRHKAGIGQEFARARTHAPPRLLGAGLLAVAGRHQAGTGQESAHARAHAPPSTVSLAASHGLSTLGISASRRRSAAATRLSHRVPEREVLPPPPPPRPSPPSPPQPPPPRSRVEPSSRSEPASSLRNVATDSRRPLFPAATRCMTLQYAPPLMNSIWSPMLMKPAAPCGADGYPLGAAPEELEPVDGVILEKGSPPPSSADRFLARSEA